MFMVLAIIYLVTGMYTLRRIQQKHSLTAIHKTESK